MKIAWAFQEKVHTVVEKGKKRKPLKRVKLGNTKHWITEMNECEEPNKCLGGKRLHKVWDTGVSQAASRKRHVHAKSLNQNGIGGSSVCLLVETRKYVAGAETKSGKELAKPPT